jgi:hypothetical protein
VTIFLKQESIIWCNFNARSTISVAVKKEVGGSLIWIPTRTRRRGNTFLKTDLNHEIFFLLSLYNRPAVSTNASHQFDKKSHPFTITSHGNQKKANTCSSYRTQPSTLNKLKAELFFLSALLDIHIKGYILLYKQRKLQGIRPMGLAQTGRDSCRAPPLN